MNCSVFCIVSITEFIFVYVSYKDNNLLTKLNFISSKKC